MTDMNGETLKYILKGVVTEILEDFTLCCDYIYCPNCGALVGQDYDELSWRYTNCYKCGQAIKEEWER